jgi:hypothetical protein
MLINHKPIMKKIAANLLLCLSITAANVYAGAKVLDVEVGATTIDALKTSAGTKIRLKQSGISTWTGGPTLVAEGADFEIEGLKSVLYIFDDQKKLSALVMTMDKSRFDAIYQFLANKYKLVSQQRPHVGNSFAKFSAPDTSVEIDAPHMSFDMEVKYLSNNFVKSFQAKSQAEAAAKKNKEKSQF